MKCQHVKAFSRFGNCPWAKNNQILFLGSFRTDTNYQKHRIYFGAHGNFDLTFPVESDSYLTFLEIPGKIQFENKFVTGTVKFPVTLDINLFGSTVGAIINISPSINGLWALSPTVTDPYNYVKLSVSQLSLGLRGKVGDRFEFSIILVEIKAVITLEDVHLAQTLNYLTAYQLPIGLLINFGAPKLQFKRMFRKDS